MKRKGAGVSSDDEAVGFAGDFSFDFACDTAPTAAAPVRRPAAGADPLERRIEEVRRERAGALEALPDASALLGSGDDESGVSSDDDDDGVEVTVDSDVGGGTEAFFGEAHAVAEGEAALAFAEMGLSKPLLKALAALGFERPTPIQAAAIPVALAGKDVCGGAVTGSGKTAAFMVPIVERLIHRQRTGPATTRVLVLLPTRELCIQCHQVAVALARFTDIRVALVAGGLPMRPQEAELRLRPEVVIATPGRLIDHLANSHGFSLESIEILVLDEADRMLEQGFADELDEILRQTPRHRRQTLMFSATMTERIDDLIRLSLQKPVRLFVDTSDTIARSLVQEFVRIREGREEDRLPIVLALCKRTLTERCILFFPTKELAHRVRILLGLVGLRAAELHGGLAQADRLDALERFKTGQVDLLVATDVASRGLDIPQVSYVLNYNMPLNYKQYVHRIGRTARAGATGRSITLVGEGVDRKILRQALKNSSQALKHRVVSKETIAEYRRLVDSLAGDLEAILASEQEDRMLDRAERDAGRAENLIKHRADIHARPAKTWFQSEKQKKASRGKEQRFSTK